MLLQGRDCQGGRAKTKKITYADRKLKGSRVVEFFGDRPLASITPDDVAEYRVQRVGYSRTTCGECGGRLLVRSVVGSILIAHFLCRCRRSIMTTRP
jgi:hypothetical protein